METIEMRDLGERDGFDLVAYKVTDEETSVDEFDCYEQVDVEAWEADDWAFVGVIVKVFKHGVELGTDSLWGVEDGYSPGFKSEARPTGVVDGFDHTLGGDGSSYDLPGEAIERAKEALAKLREEE